MTTQDLEIIFSDLVVIVKSLLAVLLIGVFIGLLAVSLRLLIDIGDQYIEALAKWISGVL
jgi:hypothetical protein